MGIGKSSLFDDEKEMKDLELEEQREAKDKAKKSKIDKEYEETFSGDEKATHSALQIKSKIDIKMERLDIEDIVVPNFKKIGREDTVLGLNGIVGEWGIVTPIHVLALEDEGSYMLLDGLRRLFAALRNGLETVPAMVWDFSDKEEGKEMANVLSLMISRAQNYSSKEMWEQMQVLEEVNDAGPGLIEYLLQMNAGDAMKLKDVMLADSAYDEIKQGLMSGELNIEAAYKKLCTQRKKENKLAKDDVTVIEGSDSSNLNEVSEDPRLSVDEVKDILELADSDDDDTDLEALNKSGEDVVYQDPKDRKPLDFRLKQQVLNRDEFTCQCCGKGGFHRLPTMAVHHIIQVSQGGPDSLENLVTLCTSCHTLVHVYAWSKMPVKVVDLTEEDIVVFKKIFKYGNIILEANKRCGKTKEQGKLEDKGARHIFPGEGLKDNLEAYRNSRS